MTVSSEVKRSDFAGNGSTTAFATGFRFLQNSDIKVILTVTATGVETVQVEVTNYTLVGAGLDAGGTVTMLIAPATGETLTIKRDVPLTQGTDYVENDTFPAESHEDALDKLTMIVQQQQEELDRTIKLAETSQSTDVTIPDPNEGDLIRWDDQGNLENVSIVNLDAAIITPFGRDLIDSPDAAAGRQVLELNALNPDTLAIAIADATLLEGDALDVKENTLGLGGTGKWDVVLTTSVTPNTTDKRQSTGNALLTLVFRITNTIAPEQLGADGTYAKDKAAIQRIIDIGSRVIISRPFVASGLVLAAESHMLFVSDGEITGIAAEQILDADGKDKIKLINPRLTGVFSGTPNLAEHAIKFTSCDNLVIKNPIISNVGGNGIQLETCLNSYIENIDIRNTGFLAFIGVDCTKSLLNNGFIQDAKDAFSVQHKGGHDCDIVNVQVVNPNSCGIIINTNVTSTRESMNCNIVNCSIGGTAAEAVISATKGMILVQMDGGTVRGCTVKDNTAAIGAGIQASAKSVKLIGNTVQDISAVGIDVAGSTSHVTLLGNTVQRCQDRGFRQQDGHVIIGSGNEFLNNALSSAIPNVDVIAAQSFKMTGSTLETVLSGTGRINLKLGAGSYDVNVNGNDFTRNNANDIQTATGEVRTDLTGKISIHSNNNAIMLITSGFNGGFEIKNGILQFESYQRANVPAIGTWVRGDKMQFDSPVAGGTAGFICVASGTPGTWKNWGSIAA